MHKPTDEENRNLSQILQVVADLNRRAADVTPEAMDEGCIYDWNGKLIGKVAADDTYLISENAGRFTVVLLNDSNTPRTCGLVIDPAEFNLQSQPLTAQAKIEPNGVEVIKLPTA